MFGGEYGGYVLAAYGATALILAALIWSTISANLRARRDLDAVDRRERGK
jgi:heme exporter protein CcmD